MSIVHVSASSYQLNFDWLIDNFSAVTEITPRHFVGKEVNVCKR